MYEDLNNHKNTGIKDQTPCHTNIWDYWPSQKKWEVWCLCSSFPNKNIQGIELLWIHVYWSDRLKFVIQLYSTGKMVPHNIPIHSFLITSNWVKSQHTLGNDIWYKIYIYVVIRQIDTSVRVRQCNSLMATFIKWFILSYGSRLKIHVWIVPLYQKYQLPYQIKLHSF